MIQVEACYEHMMAHRDVSYKDVTIGASVPNRGRGIYLREPHEAMSPKVFQVRVEPQFRELEPSLNRLKIDLEINVTVVSSVSWVKAPPYVVLPSAGRIF